MCKNAYRAEMNYFFEDYSDEIISDDILSRLLTFPNVLITSHQAFLTHEALENIARTTIENFNVFLKNVELPHEICYHRITSYNVCYTKLLRILDLS